MTINQIIKEKFVQVDLFSLQEAVSEVKEKVVVKEPSIRARIYEMIDEGILKRISKGVFSFKSALLVHGDGRDLSFIQDESIDVIITDHPYFMPKSHKGGSRNFTNEYDCFLYEQKDFDEKARVLKDGHFLVEFIPEENAENVDYLYKIKQMAKKAGFEYYAKVPWKKGDFVANTGRKSKNTEDVLIFSKGKARKLRPDAKKSKKTGLAEVMSGAKGMLPTVFDFKKEKEMIHQAEKPVELLMKILDFTSLEGETALDQFAGSGSLGVASIKSNRNSILIEIKKDNVDKIRMRLDKMTN